MPIRGQRLEVSVDRDELLVDVLNRRAVHPGPLLLQQRIQALAPGLVETDMGRRLVKGAMGVDDIHTLDERSPFGHVCTPQEVAAVVRFLVSDAGGYLTDQRIVVDGGTFQ